MKSLSVGDIVQLNDGKLAEVIEASQDQKSFKCHVRTGARVEDKYYPEFQLKKVRA